MKKLNNKAQAILYVYFFITAVIIVVIAGVLAPMGVMFNAAMYAEGEEILERSRPYINDINDLEVQAQINATVNAALDAGENNIEVNAAIFQYSWVAVLILTSLIVFMQTRRLTEISGGGFV